MRLAVALTSTREGQRDGEANGDLATTHSTGKAR